MRVRIYSLLLVPLASALIAEEPSPAPSPQDIQASQQRLGEQVGRLGDSLEELLEEAQANLGVDLQDFDTFRLTRERLADLSQRRMPTICSDLREPTTKALYGAWRRQKEIAGEIDHLLLSVQRHLAPAMSRRVLDTALDRQQEALERTRDLRTAFPDLEGKPTEALTEEQQRALSEAVEAQQQAADEMSRAQTEMQRQAGLLAGGDLSAREMLRRARLALAQAGARAAAVHAVEDLRKNHTRQAEEKQELAAGALKTADAVLAPTRDASTRSGERLAGLQEAAGQQAQALDETSRLEKGHSEEDLVRAARDQGEVSRQTLQLLARQPDLKRVHQDSETAKRKLVEGDLKGARQAQEEALKALQKALQEAATDLSRAQQQETRSRSASFELDQLRAAIRRQDELLARTQRVAANRAHALARDQADLAHTTRTMAARSRPQPPKPPATAQLAKDLQKMAELAKAEAGRSAKATAKDLEDARRSFKESGVSEELNPETYYGLMEIIHEAEFDAKEAKLAAGEASEAAAVAKRSAEALGQKREPEERRRLSHELAQAALRATAAARRCAQSDEQSQRTSLAESQALQAAAWLQIDGLPGIAESLRAAERAMTAATTELANQRPAQALPKQKEGRAALEAALHRLTAELGQTDLAMVVDVLREQTASLGETQSRLTAEALTPDAQSRQLGPRQRELAEEVDRLRSMPSVPGEASSALAKVAGGMRRAAGAFDQMKLDTVHKEQDRIDEALARALYALREAAAAAELAPAYAGTSMPKPDPGRAKRKEQVPAIEIRKPPPSAIGPAWDVALPPRERAEVNQALKEKMPERYRRQIMRYYENLSRAGLE